MPNFLISIPYGAIKRLLEFNLLGKTYMVIQNCAIKRLLEFNPLTGSKLFQFLMVRLKV